MIERGSCVPSSMPRRCAKRAGGDVAHHHFERNDLHLADQLLAHVEPADEVGRNPDIVQVLEDVFGDPVVEDALAFDDFVLFGVEGGRVILEMLDECSRLGAFVEDLRLAFVDAAAATHRGVPWFLKVHRIAVAPVRTRSEIRGGGTGPARLSRRSVRIRSQPSRSPGAAQSRPTDVFHSVISPQ